MEYVRGKEQTVPGNSLMNKIKKTLNLDMKPASNRSTIDYPGEGELVREGIYAVRISAEPEMEVEISINNGEWRPCRESIGYWWFDWRPAEAGPCLLIARSRAANGRWKKSDVRSCRVISSSSPLKRGPTLN
jgi:hypothetical protein